MFFGITGISVCAERLGKRERGKEEGIDPAIGIHPYNELLYIIIFILTIILH